MPPRLDRVTGPSHRAPRETQDTDAAPAARSGEAGRRRAEQNHPSVDAGAGQPRQVAGATSRRIGAQSALHRALTVYNSIANSPARRALVGHTPTPTERENLNRQDAQLLGAVIDAAVAADPAERSRHLGDEDLASLHVRRSTACLHRPVTRQRAGEAQQLYKAMVRDPGRTRTERLHAFDAYKDAALQFSRLCARSAHDLVAARRLIPSRTAGVDALSDAMGHPLPPSAEPMAHALFASFELMEFAAAELGELGRRGRLALEDVAPGLLDRAAELRALFLATNVGNHLASFHETTFQRLMAPSLDDLREATLDTMSMAIQSPLVGAGDGQDEVHASAHALLGTLLESATVFLHMLDLAPSTVSRATAAPAEAGLQLSLRTDRGDHVPARLRSGSEAQSLTDENLRFQRGSDGQWRTVDVDLQQALQPDPIEQQMATLSLGAVIDPWRAQASELQRYAQRLLAMDFAGEIGPCLRQLQSTHPDTLANRYQSLQDRWSGRADAMDQQVQRMDRLEAESGVDVDADLGLREALGDRAKQIREQFESLPADLFRLDAIKCHERPQARLWADLMEAGEAFAETPRPLLTSHPGTLYEIALRPRREGSPLEGRYQSAVYVHLHLKEPRSVEQLAGVRMDDLAAGHLKSRAQRAMGAQWQGQQQQAGNFDARVHRSPIDGRLLDLVLGRAGG